MMNMLHIFSRDISLDNIYLTRLVRAETEHRMDIKTLWVWQSMECIAILYDL